MNAFPEFKTNPFLAVPSLAGLLKSGRLALFLGAGVARGFGLPGWVTLVARILGRESDAVFLEEFAKKAATEQTKALDLLDDGSLAYLRKVYDALYKEIPDELFDELVGSPLLLAIAGLLTGSCRGRVQTVFSYNYDDLVEQYLLTLGYAVRSRLFPTDLGSWADVEINYVHGFLPQSWKDDPKLAELVLSEKSYRSRRAKIDAGWSSYVEHILYSKVALFIGLSGEDGAILDVLERAKGVLEKAANRPSDYLGYWLLTPDAFERNHQAILDVGMCPIPIEKADIPRFIFAVCRKSASP